eukprot:6302317-Prymnesium_polylepis.1
MRSELRAALEHLSDECLAAQRADPLTGFQVADTCRVDYPQLADEVRPPLADARRTTQRLVLKTCFAEYLSGCWRHH